MQNKSQTSYFSNNSSSFSSSFYNLFSTDNFLLTNAGERNIDPFLVRQKIRKYSKKEFIDRNIFFEKKYGMDSKVFYERYKNDQMNIVRNDFILWAISCKNLFDHV